MRIIEQVVLIVYDAVFYEKCCSSSSDVNISSKKVVCIKLSMPTVLGACNNLNFNALLEII